MQGSRRRPLEKVRGTAGRDADKGSSSKNHDDDYRAPKAGQVARALAEKSYVKTETTFLERLRGNKMSVDKKLEMLTACFLSESVMTTAVLFDTKGPRSCAAIPLTASRAMQRPASSVPPLKRCKLNNTGWCDGAAAPSTACQSGGGGYPAPRTGNELSTLPYADAIGDHWGLCLLDPDAHAGQREVRLRSHQGPSAENGRTWVGK